MEIRDIKSRLSILQVLSHYSLAPDRNGMVCCPFHEDKTASMKIYTQTDTFNCFGCGANGDQVEFCVLKEGGKRQGILKAAELAGSPIPAFPQGEGERQVNGATRFAPASPLGGSLEGAPILTKVFESFKTGLRFCAKAREYLESRNLQMTLLEAGYNSGQFHHRDNLTGEETQACIRAGLLIPYQRRVPNATGETYTPFAKDCIIFPLKDKTGTIVSLYGRSITDKGGKHYYLKNRTGLYPGYPAPGTTKLILTEAIIDASTLAMHKGQWTMDYGHASILACYGVNGLTDEHREAIRALSGLQEIVFFFDGDAPGREAADKYIKELTGTLPGIRFSMVDTPEGEDVNSLLQGHEPAILTHLIENRTPFLLTENPLTETVTSDTVTSDGQQKKENTGKPEPLPEPDPFAACQPITHKANFSNEQYITYTTDELQIVILGGVNLGQLDRLRLTLKITRTDSNHPLHAIRHTLDLYHADYLDKFIGKASEQLETGTTPIRTALAGLTQQIEQYRMSKIESRKQQKPVQRELTEAGYKKAVAYLKASGLMECTGNDIGRTGVMGEENNRLLMYLVFTSRLRDQPLHIISLGASGTGKTWLQEKVSELIPEAHKLEITILSENAFYYFGQKELKHKLVLIEDMDGAQEVLYPLRELQSKKRISKTLPLKDSKGNLRTVTLQVEGPISLAGTTTKERLFEDNANRSLLIYLDNSTGQKERIMDYQRMLSAGKINSGEENRLKDFFRDMQSVLQPVKVRNPFAQALKLPEYVFKPLRTNAHYLAVVETVTFYHQYQRQVKTDPATGEHYIETTPEDIQWANILLKDVLLAKSDELSGECRSFFERLKAWVKDGQKPSFFASQVRESFRMNPSNLKYYLLQLVRYGYVKPVGGDRYKRGYEYQVVNFEEYKHLNSSINNVLDEVLAGIREKAGGQGG